MRDCKKCLAFEEREMFVKGNFFPYCDMYGIFLGSTDAPCEKKDFIDTPRPGKEKLKGLNT